MKNATQPKPLEARLSHDGTAAQELHALGFSPISENSMIWAKVPEADCWDVLRKLYESGLSVMILPTPEGPWIKVSTRQFK